MISKNYVIAFAFVVLLVFGCINPNPLNPGNINNTTAPDVIPDIIPMPSDNTQNQSNVSNNFSDVVDENPVDVSQMKEGVNNFAFRMLKYSKDEEKNEFFSPYNIYEVTGMLYYGAEGKTKEELGTLMEYTDDLGLMIKKEDSELESLEDVELKTANGLWVDNEFELLDDYKSYVSKYFDSEVENVDFQNNYEEERQHINRWVEKNTNNKIINLFPPGSITKLSRVVLAGTIYFNGKWSRDYDEMVVNHIFYAPHKEKFVDMVEDESNYPYYETENYKALLIDYKGNRIAMLFVLPKGEEGSYKLKETIEDLSSEQLDYIINHMSIYDVSLKFPKFRFSTSYNLKNIFNDFGVITPFLGSADFSKMSEEKVYVSSAVHKAYVDVNEKGTEAAAATGFVVGITAMPEEQKEHKSFIVDHPFLFFIIDKETNIILFSGKVVDPEYK